MNAGGSAFEAHRIVLMAGSDFFDGVFSSGMAEAGSAQVTLPEVKAPARGVPADVMRVRQGSGVALSPRQVAQIR